MTTDPKEAVLPSALWKEILRVGFVPVTMDVWGRASVDGRFVVFDGARWPLVEPGATEATARLRHVRILAGSEDPPQVQVVE